MSIKLESFSSYNWDAQTFKRWMRALNINNEEAGLLLDVHAKTVSKWANLPANKPIPRLTILACQMLLLKAEARDTELAARRTAIAKKIVEDNEAEMIADTVNM